MIICGDALAELKKLKDESVNCCITSPPYYGLRDYGTAKWEGGDDEGCDHIQTYNTKRDTSGGLLPTSLIAKGPLGTRGKQISTLSSRIQYRIICAKCGARRIDNQLGLEKTPEEYIDKLVEVFREARRVLRKDGTLWVVIGDCYASCGGHASIENDGRKNRAIRAAAKGVYGPSIGLKPKDLIGIPWRVAFALQADGWWLRQDIIWAKLNPMPESVTDRCTKAHEYIFMLAKSAKYYYDAEAIKENAAWERWGKQTCKKNYRGLKPIDMDTLQSRREGGRNRRSVWTITTKSYKEAHFATFPPDLVEPMILAGCPKGGIVLDPFFGAGTTGVVAKKLGREFIGIDLNPEYCEMARRRIFGPLISAGKYQEQEVM